MKQLTLGCDPDLELGGGFRTVFVTRCNSDAFSLLSHVLSAHFLCSHFSLIYTFLSISAMSRKPSLFMYFGLFDTLHPIPWLSLCSFFVVHLPLLHLEWLNFLFSNDRCLPLPCVFQTINLDKS